MDATPAKQRTVMSMEVWVPEYPLSSKKGRYTGRTLAGMPLLHQRIRAPARQITQL